MNITGKACVRDCENELTYGSNLKGADVCVCDDKKFYDADTDSCITREECGKYTYELDGDALRCVTAETCTEMGGYALTDNGEKKCVSECPVFFETVDGARTCVASCDRFVDEGECVDTCESGAFTDVSDVTY